MEADPNPHSVFLGHHPHRPISFRAIKQLRSDAPIIRCLKIVAVIASAAILMAAAWVGYEIWGFGRPAVSARKLARLNSGMDTNAVRNLLGSPTTCEMFK